MEKYDIFKYDFFYLKSGIPAEVLIPAPVWTTICLAALTHSANLLT